MTKIVVAEYPKSGGSWLVSMMGRALSLPQRDIYVSDDFNLFDVSKHFWYEGAQSLGLTESCVIKSHELPDSPLHNFPAQYIHMLRDGRDVVVSKYFFEKDFCVKNAILKEFTMTFEEYVEKVAVEWANFVHAWEEKNVVTCKYEVLLTDTFSALQKLFSLLGMNVSSERITESIQANTKEQMRKALGRTFEYNTFVRKGIAGDWRNHFSQHHKEIFKKQAGTLLISLGYEANNDW